MWYELKISDLWEETMAKKSDLNVYSLRNFIDILHAFPKELKNNFIRDYTLNEQGENKFWEKLKKDKKYKKYFPSIQYLFTLAELTQKNLPLCRSLYRKFKSIDDLAEWEIEDWEEYIQSNKVSVPTNIDGEKLTTEEYAQALTDNFNKRFPTVALVDRIEKSKVIGSKNRSSTAIKNFLEKHSDHSN